MKIDLVIYQGAEETAIALLEEGQLVEFHKEKKVSHFSVGDIYLGKVKKVMPGLNAVFVDVGYEKDAFLHYFDLGPQFRSLKKYTDLQWKGRTNDLTLNNFYLEDNIRKDGKITDLLQKGDIIPIQISKEPLSNKGPRITTDLSLPGRYLVLIPFSESIHISQKIKNAEERRRLMEAAKAIRPRNFGMIIRTVAEGKKIEDLQQDLRQILQRWNEMASAIRKKEVPSKVLGELNRSSALLRDMFNPNFHQIITNSKEIYQEMKRFIAANAPDKQHILKLYEGKIPLFDYLGIEKQVKSLFGKTVLLKNGGYLHIEHTEALHVIDVNSGNLGRQNGDHEKISLQVNLEAAKEIARQLRLRDMGGIIVIDFIDMKQEEYRQELIRFFKEQMKHDKAKHTILPPSKFGLVEMTRQRVRPEVEVKVEEKCPCCDGKGNIQPPVLILDEIENALAFLTRHHNHKKLDLHVHPFLEAYIKKGFWSNLKRKWQRKYKCKLKVRGISSMPITRFTFFDQKEEEIVL